MQFFYPNKKDLLECSEMQNIFLKFLQGYLLKLFPNVFSQYSNFFKDFPN